MRSDITRCCSHSRQRGPARTQELWDAGFGVSRQIVKKVALDALFQRSANFASRALHRLRMMDRVSKRYAMLRVASYNIRKAIGTDRRRSPERILDVLNEIDADIVALQEADRRLGARQAVLPTALIRAHSPYAVVNVAARHGSMGWHGNALLVRQNAKVSHVARFTLPMLEPRGAVMADVDIDDVPLRVVGMHLDLSGLHRRRQGHAIVAALNEHAERPTIIMGDTNEWRPHGGCLADFAHKFRIAPTGPSFHSRRPVGRLDRIMVGNTIEIVNCGVHHSVLAARASDHLPVWADIVVTPGGAV